MKYKFNDKYKTKLIGILTILIALWLIFYFIPELFVSLFNTLLGNLILITCIILVYTHNKYYGTVMALACAILVRFARVSRGLSQLSKENFTNKSETDFLLIQNTINRQKVFDMNVIKTQASQEELDYFNKNGKWPWSQKVIDLYKSAVARNPYVRSDPEIATNYARSIYNEAAILRILSYQTKEGQFLINGVLIKDPSGNKMEQLPNGFGNFPYEAGLMENREDDIIRCNMKDDKNPTLERIRYTGRGGIFGEQNQTVTPVDYNDLEKTIPGFKFLYKPCNPCGGIAAQPDYSCSYRLRLKNKPPFVSEVWQYLWGINDNPLEVK